MAYEGGGEDLEGREGGFDCVKEDLAEKQLRVQNVADWQRWRTMTKNGDLT